MEKEGMSELLRITILKVTAENKKEKYGRKEKFTCGRVLE